MDWVKPFFDTASEWWGPPSIRQSDHDRVAVLKRLGGSKVKRILELGAGGGTTAVVTAQAGYDVVANELSSVRAEFIRRLAATQDAGVTVVEGDFYTTDFGGTFDCATYWNGFGVGTDDDQRRLLRRVASDWLSSGGCFIVDVMSPFRWARIAGEREDIKHAIALTNTNDYDPVASRYFDTWWPRGHEEQAITQSARCYTPSDLALLVEGSGLVIDHMEVGEKVIDPTEPADHSHPIWNAWEYTVKLSRA